MSARNPQLAFVLAAALALAACSDNEESPAQQIRQLIDAAVVAAERRNLGDIVDLAHDSYRDKQGFNKRQLAAVLRAFLMRHKNPHLLTRIAEIEVISENEASVKLYVAMAASEIDRIEQIPTLRAQLYHFELQLIRDSDWLVRRASWRPANLLDLN